MNNEVEVPVKIITIEPELGPEMFDVLKEYISAKNRLDVAAMKVHMAKIKKKAEAYDNAAGILEKLVVSNNEREGQDV